MATVEHVVVDSGAFIRNAPIKDIAEKVYTLSDVVTEIRDKATRERLRVLPYTLNFQEPDKESVRIVTEFSKKTGDFRSLSTTDIRVLALTYQLEKRYVGTEHIKTAPEKKIVFETGSTASAQAEVAGFYVKNGGTDQSADEKSEVAKEVEAGEETLATELMSKVEITDKEDTTLNKTLKDGDCFNDKLEECSSSDDEADSDDDEGWITPSNVEEANKAMMGSEGGEVSTCTVGCLTTDFAMQNVLIHMGLNVISVDGLRIKQAKSFVLRCYTCFKISTDVSRQFCFHCGNDTLRKLTVSLNEDGTMRYFLSKKQFKLRKKPHIPMPKGGKHSNYPRLAEDQPMPQRRQPKQKHQHYGVFDPDYIANHSPFAQRDTNSRLALHSGRNFHKRDPNAVRRRKK